jgi:two-component sensor histidine kinase
MITYTEVTTERVLAEQQKDILMKEINHRVKNNLLMISSLINLKDQALGDSVDISDLARQVDAIRVIHERLSPTDDITRIRIKDYIEELIDSVFPADFTNIHIKKCIEPVSLHSRKVVPLGLIINEIATNALKHGFVNNRQGEFLVEFKKMPSKDRYVLTISNTGIPFPKQINLENAETLGLRLISGLVDQLQGTLELQREPHPVFTITFP